MNDPSSLDGFIAPDPRDLAPLFPAYEILDLIATGGMGAVYRAVQKSLDRTVALKILPGEFSADAAFRAGFEAEAKAMARLNHPNLIGVYDSGEAGGMLYIVMEYVHGKSLHHSAHGKSIDPAEVIRLVSGICNGLAHAHGHGILHRDIKPSNVLLDPHAEPKIGDFGLATPVGRTIGDDETIFGTPGYTAPEVVEAPNSVDHRADIFSVGVLLRELLTGKLPADDSRPASQIVGCDPQFDAIIWRATNPDPAARYPTADAMAVDLRAISAPATAAVRAMPRPTPARPSHLRQTRKKGGGVAMKWIATACLLGVVAGIGAFAMSSKSPGDETADSRPVRSQKPLILVATREADVETKSRTDVIPQAAAATPAAVKEDAPAPAPPAPPPSAPPLRRETPFGYSLETPASPGGAATPQAGVTGLKYRLYIKSGPGGWSDAADGSPAGAPGQGKMMDAFSLTGLPFAAEFRISLASGEWLPWTPCDGRELSGKGRRLEAIQFRFPNGIPGGQRLYGRVYLGGVGWLKTVLIDHLTVLGTTQLSRRIEAIQLLTRNGDESARQVDAAFNALLPPGSAPVPPQSETLLPEEPGFGRWIWNNSNRSFSLLPDGVLLQSARPGDWTTLNAGKTPRIYEFNWDDRSVDTMSVNGDGGLLVGHSKQGMNLICSRVDGASQSRTGTAILPESPAGAMIGTATDRPRPTGVPAGTTYFRGKWYQVFYERCGWKAARDKCAVLGGQLVTIPDQATQDFVRSLAKANVVWLGATDDENEGRWRWVDGSEMAFKAFAKGEPNDIRNEDMLGMQPDGSWNDSADSWKDVVGYVCEWAEQAAKTGRLPAPVGPAAESRNQPAEEFRIWTHEAKKTTFKGKLVAKTVDNSWVRIVSEKGETHDIKTALLIEDDRDYIRKWSGEIMEIEVPKPPPIERKADPAPKGIVLDEPGKLRQAQGGNAIQIDELGVILKPYADPVNDLDAHPDMTIYSGPAPVGGDCRITYLMSRVKAEELLLGRAGLTIALKAVAPGFPPGLSIHNYDRKFGDYDHLTLVVDGADQVVTLLFKSDTGAMWDPRGRWPIFRFRTLNYVNLKVADGGVTQVRGSRKDQNPVMVNIHHVDFRETVTWYVPKPLIRLILFNVEEKKKMRN